MNQSFTRSDLAIHISQSTDCSVEKAKKVVDDVIQAVANALKSGRKVEFRGFGVLEVVGRREKIGRNPKNPKAGTYKIPARNVVKFRLGKELDESLNPSEAAA